MCGSALPDFCDKGSLARTKIANKMLNTNLIVVVALTLWLGALDVGSLTEHQSATESYPYMTAKESAEVQPEAHTSRAEQRSAADGTKVLTINHHQVECEGAQVGHCLLAKEDDGPWKFLYHKIEGFDYQWGVESRLLVKPGSAGIGAGYELVSVEESRVVKSDTHFDYVARGGHGGIVRTGEHQFSLRGEKTFSCAPQVCDRIDSLLSDNQSVLLRFSHSGHVDKPLILESVLCVGAPGVFYRSCAMPDYSNPIAS